MGHGPCQPGNGDGGQMLGPGHSTPKAGCKCLGQAADEREVAPVWGDGRSDWLGKHIRS